MIEQFNQPIPTRKARLAAAAILLGALMPGAAFATTAVSCAPTLVRVISQTTNTNLKTTSDAFSVVPGTTSVITTTGASSCVIVDFTGMVALLAPGAMFLSATLDGKVSVPDYSQVIATAGAFEARSTSFVFTGVPAGSHQFKLLFRSSSNGVGVEINRSTVAIHYTH
ncbi:MAG TPA: hypothetical protein VG986_12350 [Pseudolabrys sp.]|nr:hypothetical protein [Pseudolabrys sp.]